MATAALIQQLIAGRVVAPDEPWIRSYLGLPAAPSDTTAPGVR